MCFMHNETNINNLFNIVSINKLYRSDKVGWNCWVNIPKLKKEKIIEHIRRRFNPLTCLTWYVEGSW